MPGGTVREHLDSLRVQIEECLDHAPLFFNAHSGYDNWSFSEAGDFYGDVLDLEKRSASRSRMKPTVSATSPRHGRLGRS